MEIAENTLYYTEDYLKGELLNSKGVLNSEVEIKTKTLKDSEVDKLIALLVVGSDPAYRHRCVSVYRDAIKIQGSIYNMCLSCGDFYRNNEFYYLNNRDTIRTFLNNIKNND